jgi:DNA-binding NtrC family response regulator
VAINSAIILSTDEETISVCSKCTRELEMDLVCKRDFPCMILELQENDYKVIMCDCSENFQKCSNWIKVIKKIRPKIPLIVFTEEIDKSTGAKLYQEGIFDLCEKPLSKNYLKEVLSAIITSSGSGEKFNNFNNI